MKQIIKLLSLTLCLIFLLSFCTMGLAGCGKNSCYEYAILPEYENGYYRYALSLAIDKTQKAYLTGLTGSGMQQTELICPETIDGYPVCNVGYWYYFYGIGGNNGNLIQMGSLYSTNLKKFFIPNYEKLTDDLNAWLFYPSVKIIVWTKLFDYNLTALDYVFSIAYDIGYSYDWTIGYNVYDKQYKPLVWIYKKFHIANVTYIYNYENAPNDGYYWVDTYNESLITFLPPEPEREGYTFAGWYKDPEGTNEWNFEEDKTGAEIYCEIEQSFDYDKFFESYEKLDYSGVYLYAKWVEN